MRFNGFTKSIIAAATGLTVTMSIAAALPHFQFEEASHPNYELAP